MDNLVKKSGKDLYFVAVKLFLEDDYGNLLIIKDRFNCWDLPGGRIKQDEFNKPLDKIIKRKIREELGAKVRYQLGQPKVFMRHQRNEILPDGKKKRVRIFAIGYQARYLQGDIILGKNHQKFEFVNLKKFKPEKYFKGGWLKGVVEYLTKRS